MYNTLCVFSNAPFLVFILQQAKILTPKDEEEVDHILSRLAVIIRQRRLDAWPYFKDFEQVGVILFLHHAKAFRDPHMRNGKMRRL